MRGGGLVAGDGGAGGQRPGLAVLGGVAGARRLRRRRLVAPRPRRPRHPRRPRAAPAARRRALPRRHPHGAGAPSPRARRGGGRGAARLQRVPRLAARPAEDLDPAVSGALLRYRVMAVVVGIGLLVLVGVGVPLRYAAGHPGLEEVVGPLHGALYIVYLVTAFDLARRERLPLLRLVAMVGAGFVPF